MRRSAVIVVILALIVIIGGIVALTYSPNNGSSHSSNSPSSNFDRAPAPGRVNIRDMMFTPSQITVQRGAIVTWTNNDTTTHTVVDDLSNVGGPHSGSIPPGSNYSFTFNKTGSFQYHCTLHPSMRGTIVVR